MRIKYAPAFALLSLLACDKPQKAATQSPQAPPSPYTSVVSIALVQDYPGAVAWYQSWIGRAPDVTPAPGIAEWQLADSAWIQVSKQDKASGHASIAIGVKDLQEQATRLEKAKIAHSPMADHGFIKIFETKDPAGNTIYFVQESVPPSP